MVLLGEVFPDFEAESTDGPVKFHEWLNGSWAILFSHPADFTPVCTTELGEAAKLAPEFQRRGVKMMAISCNKVQDHRDWIQDIASYCQLAKPDSFPYPIVADPDRNLAVKLGMLDPVERTSEGLALSARAVFIIGPDNKMKLSMLYPATTGRNFHEILRVIDSLQLTAEKKVATPVNWKPGDRCMVIPSLSQEEAVEIFGDQVQNHEVPSGKGYLRTTECPK